MENDTDLKILEKEYLTTKNPIYIILAFVTAYHSKRSQPKWIIDQIGNVFTEYISKMLSNEYKKLSLDKLFGLYKGRGRSSRAVDRLWLYRRDYELMEGIFRLRTLFKNKMTINDVSKIIHAYYVQPKNRPSAWPFIQSPGKLAQTYKAMKWKDHFQERHFDQHSNTRFAVKLLKYAPREVQEKKKYQPIMNQYK